MYHMALRRPFLPVKATLYRTTQRTGCAPSTSKVYMPEGMAVDQSFRRA